MNVASWNVRGLNKSTHQRELINFIAVNSLSFIGLMETKVKEKHSLVVSKKIKKSWSWFFNYDHHYNGRVWVGWDPSIWHVTVYTKSAQHITCFVTFLEKNLTFMATFVYAYNEAQDRVPLWQDLNSLSSTNLPWCCLGDFNCVISINEVRGGREHWTPAMQAFKDCLSNAGLTSIRTVGDLFTWTDKRADPILKCLDRVVGNGLWLNTHTEGYVINKNRSIMDHNPLILSVPMQLTRYSKPFQFYNFMIEIPGFLQTVLEAWNSTVLFGNPMAILCRKLKVVKEALVNMNKRHGNLQSNVKVARDALADIQDRLAVAPSDELRDNEASTIVKLNQALLQEESLLLQKSRVKWLSKGDGNNKFFHNQCKSNWNQNKVLALVNQSGTMLHGQRDCAKIAVDYFTDVLGSPNHTSLLENDDILEGINCPNITQTQAAMLEAPVTRDIIYSTLKKMGKNKAPGPDGFNPEFFLATWSIVGDCFCNAVLSLFNDLNMHRGVNSTNIALIPKVLTPANMRDFRPISLCTVAYKCISKIIANRLKLVLPSTVDIAQSAFIPGRNISDNILLAQELFRGYDRESGASRCAMKIDLHKAFDSVKWDFIFAVLHKMQFPPRFISWI